MQKTISYDIFMSAKRVAQACNSFYAKRNRLKKQIDVLSEEYQKYDDQIKAFEAGINQITGFRVENLVKKVIEPVIKDGVPVLDKTGHNVKVTKYVPADNVSYDKEHKVYVISIPDTPITAPEAPSEEDLSSDL